MTSRSKRDRIIYDMCLTYDHRFCMGPTDEPDAFGSQLSRGEYDFIWRQMSQMYDNCISRHINEDQYDH